jgi:hypothetical protein
MVGLKVDISKKQPKQMDINLSCVAVAAGLHVQSHGDFRR